MISKNDTRLYFEQIACNARGMIYGVHDALIALSDPYLIGVLKDIAADEMRHYTAILDLLNAKSLKSPEAEKRLLVRRDILGTVRLTPKNLRAAKSLDAYCVNLSHGGMCFEMHHPTTPGQVFDVVINPYDQTAPIRRSGKVVWAQETLPGFFTAGMQFET